VLQRFDDLMLWAPFNDCHSYTDLAYPPHKTQGNWQVARRMKEPEFPFLGYKQEFASLWFLNMQATWWLESRTLKGTAWIIMQIIQRSMAACKKHEGTFQRDFLRGLLSYIHRHCAAGGVMHAGTH
jgi:hypothetical protein